MGFRSGGEREWEGEGKRGVGRRARPTVLEIKFRPSFVEAVERVGGNERFSSRLESERDLSHLPS